MDILSFGAKVMLMLNPQRKYQINAPNKGMTDIIIKALKPGEFSFGTIETLQRQKKILDEHKKIYETGHQEAEEKFAYISGLINKYPPLLSKANSEFVVFDKENLSQKWLTIKQNNHDYNWMFTSAFENSGDTYFIVVDLIALANNKRLESL